MRQSLPHISDLVAFWDFQEGSLLSVGPQPVLLEARGEPLEYVEEGIFGPCSLRFRNREEILANNYLVASATTAPTLNIGGPEAQVTVIAWIKREASSYSSCEFVAGVWNEHKQRQYGLFLNLGIWDSAQQVGAHVSSHGGATPGYPYCMDAAIGKTPLPLDEWLCVGFTYDSETAIAYVNGEIDYREPQGQPGRNPFNYGGGLNQVRSDFTVGAVERPATVKKADDGSGFVESGGVIANPFIGLLGGLAIYNRALTEEEMQLVSANTSFTKT